MDHRIDYHQAVMASIGHLVDRVDFTRDYRMPDGVVLNATLFNSDENTGIMIIPGIWYPRELYYKIAADLSDEFKVLIYDLRGHSLSGGEFDLDLMVGDAVHTAREFSAEEKLENLFVLGHSLGGYLSARASADGYPPSVKGQVIAAAPLSLTATTTPVPRKLGRNTVYLLNLARAVQPKYRSFIVRQYASFWFPAFRKNPHLFALRTDNPNGILDEIRSSEHLSGTAGSIETDTLFLWPDRDETLGFKGDYPPAYRDFIRDVIAPCDNMLAELAPGLNHQFNRNRRKVLMLAGDNDYLVEKIRDYISGRL